MARVQLTAGSEARSKVAELRNALLLATFLACSTTAGAYAAEGIVWNDDPDSGCDPAIAQAQRAAAQAGTEALIAKMNKPVTDPAEMAQDCLNDIMNSDVNDSLGLKLPGWEKLKKAIMEKACSFAKSQADQYLGTSGSYQLDPISSIPLPSGWSIPTDTYSVNTDNGNPTISTPYGTQPAPATGGGYSDILKGLFNP